jgi:mannose/fructose/N-acetylgalactosamine-specific phosphotransferase system component IIC
MEAPPWSRMTDTPDPSASGRRAPPTYDSAIAVTEAQLRRQASSGGIRLGWSIALLACVVQTAAYLTNELVLDTRFHQLDAATDGTLFAWANTLAIVCLTVVVITAAIRGLMRTSRATVLAVGLGLLAVDDATGAHDRMRGFRMSSLPGPPRTAEAVTLAAFVLLLAIVFFLLWAEGGGAPGRAKGMMRAGLLALAFAVVTRLVGAVFGRDGTYDDVVRAVGVAVEQGLDLGGWILVAAGYALSVGASAPGQSSSPPPHWPAFTATLTENARPASITAPTLPDGAAKTRWFTR